MHIDSSDYKDAKIGVAIGDTVCGKYTYLRSERPLGFESRDSGVFVDDDGKGYLLTEDVRYPLMASRYLHITNKGSAQTVFASMPFRTTISTSQQTSTNGLKNTNHRL